MNEKDVRVAGGIADIETVQLLIIKRSVCPIAFCNYKCLSIGLFLNSAVFFSFIYHETNKFLQADGGLSLHAKISFSVGEVM